MTESKEKPSISHILTNLEGMQSVTTRISEKFSSEHPLISEITEYLFDTGGKRLRPALTLLVAQAFSLKGDDPRLVDIAAGIELIHMGTLLHDDIIDRSPLRRKHVSPFVKYGADATLICGDFLLVRAFSLCASLDRKIIDATETACVHLTEGEIAEGSLDVHTPSIDDYYYKIAAKKTAALFALGAFSAGHIAGLREEETLQLKQFGQDLGIAFQILDDILDVTSDSETLGKQPGQDIRERKPSIVNLFWLKSGDPLAQKLLTPANSEQKSEEDRYVEEALESLRSGNNNNAIHQCREEARKFALSARENLHKAAKASSLTNSQYIAALDTLINYTLTRVA